MKHVLWVFLWGNVLFAQEKTVASYNDWWNLLHYHLKVSVYPESQTIVGSNQISYQVKEPQAILPIKLQLPLVIDSIVQNGHQLTYTSKNNLHYIQLQQPQIAQQTNKLTIYYHGAPHKAKNAPWDGGFTWTKDEEGNDFIATSNQGIGASIWWPCKDDDADETDQGVTISITCPSKLINVSNGKLISQSNHNNNTSTYTWQTVNPINAYGVCINIGNYQKINVNYPGLKGNLTCDFYVLPYQFKKIQHLISNTQKTLQAFEYWLGPYPFYEDSYKLIATPYLGMEHQSAIAYGNQFLNGYLGYPMGNSKWGLQFDYIVVHETAHEWFANNITCATNNDLWIHEAFATYAESLFVDYHFGKKAANEYVQGLQKMVVNKIPIVRTYTENFEEDADVYYKGALMLHTLRNMVNDDKLWQKILITLNQQFYHQTVVTAAVENFLIEKTKLPLEGFFNQYLRTNNLPKLVLQQEGQQIVYYWKNVVHNFKMPLKATLGKQEFWIYPTTTPQKINGKLKKLKIDPNFYINIEK